jgi:hypothetical protein
VYSETKNPWLLSLEVCHLRQIFADLPQWPSLIGILENDCIIINRFFTCLFIFYLNQLFVLCNYWDFLRGAGKDSSLSGYDVSEDIFASTCRSKKSKTFGPWRLRHEASLEMSVTQYQFVTLCYRRLEYRLFVRRKLLSIPKFVHLIDTEICPSDWYGNLSVWLILQLINDAVSATEVTSYRIE